MIKVKKLKLNYLVTGTGRCGTVYMARLLTSLGINCGHEAIFNYQGLDFAKEAFQFHRKIETSHCSSCDILHEQPIDSWIDMDGKIHAESSYMAAPFLNDDILKSTKIIHVVRHPLKVISSFTKDFGFFDYDREDDDPWVNFVLTHMPELKEINDKNERACYYYTKWNEMIECNISSHDNMRHKVEDGHSRPLLEFIGVKDDSNAFVNLTINSWKKRTEDLTLDEIPDGSIKKEFIAIGERYEYL
jgi:hypothetical protein